MRIGIDARPLAGPRTGIRNYLYGLLTALAKADSVHEFILYAHRPMAFDLPNSRWHIHVHRGIGAPGPIWLQLHASQLAIRDRIDVFWGVHFLLPLRLPRRIPAAVTVYDLVPFVFPRTMEFKNYLMTRLLLPPSLARAQRVMVISETAGRDLQRLFQLPPERISVVSPGVAPHFRPHDPAEARARVARTLGIERPYLLTVGTLEPRKNLITLVRAVAALPTAVRGRVSVVVAGASGWKNSSVYAAAAPLVQAGRIRFLGYVPEDELPWLYAGTTLFLFPSLYEGFGMPVAEAMASGAPVVVSDIPVAHEVAGDAAAYVAPTDADAWAKTILRLLSDPAQQTAMRDRGIRQAARFSFEESAMRLITVLERLVEAGDLLSVSATRHPLG